MTAQPGYVTGFSAGAWRWRCCLCNHVGEAVSEAQAQEAAARHVQDCGIDAVT